MSVRLLILMLMMSLAAFLPRHEDVADIQVCGLPGNVCSFDAAILADASLCDGIPCLNTSSSGIKPVSHAKRTCHHGHCVRVKSGKLCCHQLSSNGFVTDSAVRGYAIASDTKFICIHRIRI